MSLDSEDKLRRILFDRYYAVKSYFESSLEKSTAIEMKLLSEKKYKKLYMLSSSKLESNLFFLYYGKGSAIDNVVMVLPLNLTRLLRKDQLITTNGNEQFPAWSAIEIFLLPVRNPSYHGRPKDWILYALIRRKRKTQLIQVEITDEIQESIQAWYVAKKLQPVSVIQTGSSKKVTLNQEYTMNTSDNVVL